MIRPIVPSRLLLLLVLLAGLLGAHVIEPPHESCSCSGRQEGTVRASIDLPWSVVSFCTTYLLARCGCREVLGRSSYVK